MAAPAPTSAAASAIPPRPVLINLAMVCLLGAGTVLLYSRVLGADFLNYDDPRYVTENPYVRSGLTWAGLRWAFFGHADYWHPLTWLSHMLDWSLYADNAAGHHLTNVLWHGLNAVLIWWVLRRMTGAPLASVWGAALFAWHPLRVESVAWITERKDVMSGTFFLLTVAAYLAYRARPAAARYGLTLVLFLAGLACKPTLVTLPLVLMALDYWPGAGGAATVDRGPRPGRWRWWAWVPFFGLAAVVAIVTVRMQTTVGAFSLAVPLADRIGNAWVSLARYLGLTLWPFDLAVCYPHPGHWPGLTVAGAVVLIVGVSGVAWWQRSRRPWLLISWVIFLALLLPTLGLLQVGVQAMADRYTYLPAFGVSLVATMALRRPRPVRWAGAGLALLGLAVATWQQQAVWQNSETLFRHAVAVTRDNSFARAYLAHTLMDEGRWTEAQQEAEAAVALNPGNDTAWFVLAGAYDRAGRRADAIDAYRRILAVRPGDVQSEFLLGALLAQSGSTTEALPLLRAAVQQVPDYVNRCWQGAQAALAAGELPAAAVLLTVYTEARPHDVEGWLAQAVTQRQLGRIDDALASLAQGAAAAPEDPRPEATWAELLARRRQYAAALEHYEKALARSPQDASLHAAAGYMLWLVDRRAEAVARWREALRIEPAFPGLRERLEAAAQP